MPSKKIARIASPLAVTSRRIAARLDPEIESSIQRVINLAQIDVLETVQAMKDAGINVNGGTIVKLMELSFKANQEILNRAAGIPVPQQDAPSESGDGLRDEIDNMSPEERAEWQRAIDELARRKHVPQLIDGSIDRWPDAPGGDTSES